MIAGMRVGLVGCGAWGRHILRDLVSLGCEVPVVARSDASIARARDGGAIEIVRAIAELPPVDGLVVATPTSTHADVLDTALALGVPVFVEKPLCPDPAPATRLAAEAVDRLFVMDKWRYHAGVLELGAIARGERHELGSVRGLRTSRFGWGQAHDDVDAAWVLAPHDLSIAIEIVGRLPPVVAAVGQRGPLGLVSLVGLLADETVWVALEVSERSPRRERRIELHCDGGVAVLADGWDGHVTLTRTAPDGSAVDERVETPGELPLQAELRSFVEHLRGGPPPRSSAAEGALVVETIARLRELAGVR
jgi:predicted dehydrogenase